MLLGDKVKLTLKVKLYSSFHVHRCLKFFLILTQVLPVLRVCSKFTPHTVDHNFDFFFFFAQFSSVQSSVKSVLIHVGEGNRLRRGQHVHRMQCS